MNLIYETLDLVRKWLADFNAGKFQVVSFDWSNNSVAVDVKIMGLFLRKNYLLICWVGFLFQIGLWLLHYLYC